MKDSLKLTVFAIVAFFSFASCSDDDKREKLVELEYRIAIETLVNPIVSITYVDNNNEQVTVTGDDELITTTTDMTIFSKTISVRPPFEAQLTVMFQNNSDVAVPYLISIAEDGVIAVSDDDALPASGPHQNSIAFGLEVEQ